MVDVVYDIDDTTEDAPVLGESLDKSSITEVLHVEHFQ